METINFLGIAGVAAIVIICFMIGLIVKATGLDNKWIPVICGVFGGICGVLAMMSGMPNFPATDYFTAVAVGIVSGLGSVGCHQIYRQLIGDSADNSNHTEVNITAELEELRANKILLEAMLEAQQNGHDMNGDMVDSLYREE